MSLEAFRSGEDLTPADANQLEKAETKDLRDIFKDMPTVDMPDRDWPPVDRTDTTAEKLDSVFVRMGLVKESSESIKSETKSEAESAENSYGNRLEKNPDGTYVDKETGKTYDSVEDWCKAQETLAKRYYGTADYYKAKADKEWARYKNAEENGETSEEKSRHYQRSQEYYAKAKECREKADDIMDMLGKPKRETEAKVSISDIVPSDRKDCVEKDLSRAPDGMKQVIADVAGSIKVKDGTSGETCHFNPLNRTIVMNPDYDDAEYSEVFGHELGHAADAYLEDASSDPQFITAIKADMTTYDSEGFLSDMLDDLASSDAIFDRSVSDILSGMFLNDDQVRERYDEEGAPFYMHSNDYWLNGPQNAIAKETFANLFRVYSDPSRTDSSAFLEKHFPNTCTQFKKQMSI